GDAYNVVPETGELAGTVRTLKPEVAQIAEQRMRAICTGIAGSFGAEIEFDYDANYPVTFNHAEETVFAADVAAAIAGETNVHRDIQPLMGGEDFSYMLQARPGAFIFLGNGDTAGLHHPAYDFNDDTAAYGVSYGVKLAETTLAGQPHGGRAHCTLAAHAPGWRNASSSTPCVKLARPIRFALGEAARSGYVSNRVVP